MNWIFEHLNIVFIVGGAIAWWLNQRGKKDADENLPPHQETTFDDPDLAERTRRIREEIQKKIEQRARGYTQPTRAQQEYREPPPLVTNAEPPRLPPRPAPSRGLSRVEAERQAEILEQQASMAERLRAAQEMKRAAQQRAAFEAKAAMQVEDDGRQVRQKTRSVVVEELRDPAALRRAFVLREIIGPPVALR